jgi:hypothetical protein
MQEWYVFENGATTGPFTTEALKASIAAGKVGAAATFCVTGTTTFRTLAEHPELAPPPPAAPTELPIAKASCGACQCPVFRALKKVIVLAALAAIGFAIWAKLGHHCGDCIKPF